MKRLLVLVAIAGCGTAVSQPSPTVAPGKPSTADVLGGMATLVGLVPAPGYIEDWAAKIDGGKAQIGAFIDEILNNERFASDVIPSLVFGSYVNVRNYYALPSSFVLKRGDTLDAPLYLREPCAPSEAVKVRPWWALETEVAVCPDAYRPEKWTMAADEHSYKTKAPLSCDSQIGSPEAETTSLCGCGPNLIRCLRDAEQYDAINASLANEVKLTTAHVVKNNWPMASLFTTNGSFRDRNAELYYRRQKIGALEIARPERELSTLAQWPAEGKWAPREEQRAGQHAGVLTAPQILHWLPDRRQRQRGYYEILWCNLRNSFGATTQKVLEINSKGNNFFSHESWKQLAHTEMCTTCHARLDYGFQFFIGYNDSRASTHYNVALHPTGSGPLYGEDIKDLRGEAPLTPLGFAKLATAQPDFKGCMANHFTQYVLGDQATPDDIRAIEAAVQPTSAFKPAMKVALERYAKKLAEPATTAPAVAPSTAPAPTPGDGVAVTPALREKLDTYCIDCHDQAAYVEGADSPDLAFDVRPAVLPRSFVVSMADQVAFGMMPKGGHLDRRTREEIVRAVVGALWTDPAARAEAEQYYLTGARGLPAQQLDNAIHAIGQLAGTPSDVAWGAIERGIWADQATITPGFLAVTGLDALRACARANAAQPGKLEECVTRATQLKTLSRWPLPK